MNTSLCPGAVCAPRVSADALPFVPDARVLLFPIRREELRRPQPTDGPDAAEFAPRWWPAPAEAE